MRGYEDWRKIQLERSERAAPLSWSKLERKWLLDQFEKIDEPGVVWCEVLDCDLHMLEKTQSLNDERK